jgi:hypothetical protein
MSRGRIPARRHTGIAMIGKVGTLLIPTSLMVIRDSSLLCVTSPYFGIYGSLFYVAFFVFDVAFNFLHDFLHERGGVLRQQFIEVANL